VPSRQALRVTIPPGESLPLQGGAFGKALLAFAPADLQEEVLALEPPPGAPDPERLRADLADVVTSGIARAVGEVVSGTVGIAVPIFRYDGIVAAVGVTGPEGRCGLTWRTRVAKLLPGAAGSIVAGLTMGLSSQDSRDPA
jgi:DNA-binding IclR family transcriptional regulator